MTTDKNFKRLVRERAANTGQSYAAARRHLLNRRGETMTNHEDGVVVEITSVVDTIYDDRDFSLVTLTEVASNGLCP